MSKLNILFLCTGNSCRSQMAEGYCRAFLGERFNVYSAGTKTHGLNPLAVQVMQEEGIDISRHHSKTVQDMEHLPFHCVVTVCDDANETCPTFPRLAKRIHKSFDDPPRLSQGMNPADTLAVYRRVRDEIKAYIQTLPQELESHQKERAC